MNTCGTCKYLGEGIEDSYWDAEAEKYVNRTFHVCGLLAHLNAIPSYAKKNLHQPLETAAAGVVDGSGYYAALCVSDDFGCNQWEERPALPQDASQL